MKKVKNTGKSAKNTGELADATHVSFIYAARPKNSFLSCMLIDEMHESQRKVDRMDFLIRHQEKQMK